MTDPVLIQRIQAGDAGAERELYERHVERVYRLAHRMTGDATLAEDATQDTFIRVFDRLDDFRGDGAFGGWLHRIATTVILGHLRKHKRTRTWEHADDELVAIAGSAARDVLLDMARDKSLDEELRARALFMAGHQGHVEAATLKEIYDSTDSVDMKRQICHVLATMDDREAAFETLLEIVRNEDDPEIRRDAVFWMGQFDDPRAADFLLEIINEK